MNAIAQVSAARLSGPKLDNRRVLAGIVDVLIVTAGALVILYAGDSLTGERQGALSAVILGWALYYYFALESGAGQTVGKKLMKLRVVRADGRPAGMREVAVRTILRVVDGIGLYIVGLIVMLVTGERRQRIGDLAAGTIVVDASGPATTVAPPAAPDAEADAEAGEEDDAEDAEEPVAVAEPTRTITLPSRPARPETLSDLTEPAADEATPLAEPEEVTEYAEPVVDEPVAEAEPFEVEPFEVKPFHVEPMELDSVVPDADDAPLAEVAEEPAVEVEAPATEEELSSAMSPSLEGLATDVAAAQEATPADAGAPVEDESEASDDDAAVNVKSVETVSAMDLIMGAAEEDSAKRDEDEGPASA